MKKFTTIFKEGEDESTSVDSEGKGSNERKNVSLLRFQKRQREDEGDYRTHQKILDERKESRTLSTHEEGIRCKKENKINSFEKG